MEAQKPKFIPKVKELLTVPVLKMENNTPYYIKLTSEIFDGKALDDREAPKMVRAINLETGETCEVILNTIAYQTIQEHYTGSLIGKCFAIQKRSIEGKKYKAVDLAEIEDPTVGAETQAEKDKAAKSMKAGK